MTQRVTINLVAFVLLTLGMLWWGADVVLRLDSIEQPYRIVAEFDTSPGLSPRFETTYQGHAIGSIDAVDLVDGRVEVTLRIDRGVEIPTGATAAVRRKSPVGEPYIDLSPPQRRGSDDVMVEGDRIPVVDTSTPLAYSQLFRALNDLSEAIDARDIATLTGELAHAVDGRAASVRQIIEGFDAVAASVLESGTDLDQLLMDVNRVTQVVADRSASVASGVDDLRLLVATLEESSGALTQLLDEGAGHLASVNWILANGASSIGCTLDAAGSFLAAVGPEAEENIVGLLSLSQPVLDLIDTVRDDDGYTQGTPLINVGDNQPETYPEPLPVPQAPQVPVCPQTVSVPPPTAPPVMPAGPIPATGAPAVVVPAALSLLGFAHVVDRWRRRGAR